MFWKDLEGSGGVQKLLDGSVRARPGGVGVWKSEE